MPKKYMVTLYYPSSADARADCDVLGIDKRNVQSLQRRYSETTGHYGTTFVEKKPVQVPLTHILRVAEDKVRPHVEKMHHIDDETTW